MNNERIIFLDIMRILSVFCVMVIHVSASNWYSTPPASFAWQVFNVYDSLVRFCVPLLVMISGYLFLDPAKKITIQKLYKKYIFRILTTFVFWSALYAIIRSKIYNEINSNTIKSFIKYFLSGHYHLWFLYMIVGLYLIIPFLKKIVAERRLVEYFLLLTFIFTFLFPAIKLLIPMSIDAIDLVMTNSCIYFVLGYTIYFIGGHYFGTYDISMKLRIIIYVIGIGSVLFTIIMSSFLSVAANEANSEWYSYLLPNTGLITLAVFLFFKNAISKISFNANAIKIIMTFSKYSFGMYLVHVFFLIYFDRIGFSTTLFNPVFSVPIIAICDFICSFFAIYIIDKIPILNKYVM